MRTVSPGRSAESELGMVRLTVKKELRARLLSSALQAQATEQKIVTTATDLKGRPEFVSGRRPAAWDER